LYLSQLSLLIFCHWLNIENAKPTTFIWLAWRVAVARVVGENTPQRLAMAIFQMEHQPRRKFILSKIE
jgi:hypothetical protein